MFQQRNLYRAVIVLLCSFVLQAQPQQSTTSASSTSRPQIPQAIKDAFASLAAAPANGFSAMNDAITEAARALVTYVGKPADAASQALGNAFAPLTDAQVAAEATLQNAVATSISRMPPDILSSLGTGELAGLKWIAEDLAKTQGLENLELAARIADKLQGGLDTADGVQNADLLQTAIGIAGIYTPAPLELAQALAEAGLKASGVPDEQIGAVKALAASTALESLAGSSSLQFVSNADAIDAINSAVKEAVNGITGASLEAADAMDQLVASGRAEQMMGSAANAAVNTATAGAVTVADNSNKSQPSQPDTDLAQLIHSMSQLTSSVNRNAQNSPRYPPSSPTSGATSIGSSLPNAVSISSRVPIAASVSSSPTSNSGAGIQACENSSAACTRACPPASAYSGGDAWAGCELVCQMAFLKCSQNAQNANSSPTQPANVGNAIKSTTRPSQPSASSHTASTSTPSRRVAAIRTPPGPTHSAITAQKETTDRAALKSQGATGRLTVAASPGTISSNNGPREKATSTTNCCTPPAINKPLPKPSPSVSNIKAAPAPTMIPATPVTPAPKVRATTAYGVQLPTTRTDAITRAAGPSTSSLGTQSQATTVMGQPSTQKTQPAAQAAASAGSQTGQQVAAVSASAPKVPSATLSAEAVVSRTASTTGSVNKFEAAAPTLTAAPVTMNASATPGHQATLTAAPLVSSPAFSTPLIAPPTFSTSIGTTIPLTLRAAPLVTTALPTLVPNSLVTSPRVATTPVLTAVPILTPVPSQRTTTHMSVPGSVPVSTTGFAAPTFQPLPTLKPAPVVVHKAPVIVPRK